MELQYREKCMVRAFYVVHLEGSVLELFDEKYCALSRMCGEQIRFTEISAEYI
jgi:hypothetical protein